MGGLVAGAKGEKKTGAMTAREGKRSGAGEKQPRWVVRGRLSFPFLTPFLSRVGKGERRGRLCGGFFSSG